MNGIQFGAGEKLDWREELTEPDPDDEQIETPADVVAALGFDPAEDDEPDDS